MSAVNPTEVTGLIVDEFIRYASFHLTTVGGKIFTNSFYPPLNTPGPGVLPWVGYSVDPSTPSSPVVSQDDFPSKEAVDEDEPQYSKYIEEEFPPGITKMEFNASINQARTGVNVEDVVTETKWSEGKPFVSGFRGGGFSAGFSGAVSVDLGKLDLSADWVTLAAQFIGKNEGFAARASWDYNAYRLGFGSDKILGSDGKVRDVLPPASYYRQTGEKQPANGDTTTVEAALQMLQYEVSVPYKNRLVGNASYQISEAVFNGLNNKQKAALISYVYNVGSLRQGIADAVKSNNFAGAAQQIAAGPITADGQVVKGLVRRRSEEATLFSS